MSERLVETDDDCSFVTGLSDVGSVSLFPPIMHGRTIRHSLFFLLHAVLPFAIAFLLFFSETRTKMGEDAPAKKYRALVVDSGPIIRLSGLSTLWNKAETFYTVPAVVEEIRDAKAREHLEQLPFELRTKDPSPEGIQKMIDFAKQTGDYPSLSSVDIQVLGLLYDLEREGCRGDLSHIRTSPKRVIGLGKIEKLSTDVDGVQDEKEVEPMEKAEDSSRVDGASLNRGKNEPTLSQGAASSVPPPGSGGKTSWAALVNPSVSATNAPEISNVSSGLTKMHLGYGSQFSDAEEDSFDDSDLPDDEEEIEAELKLEYPSLRAAATVPFEDEEKEGENHEEELKRKHMEDEKRKEEALKPKTKSGKLYNSFTRYKDLMKPTPKPAKVKAENVPQPSASQSNVTVPQPPTVTEARSRIIGGSILAGQDDVIEDDGEGWIMHKKDIETMKANGVLDPVHGPGNPNQNGSADGPSLENRAACATTDFAMQNVILQMNLELLSVDGMKVRKLKSWVTRCGACFRVYTNSEAGLLGKRLFCEHCGSDMMQRVAASVDGKTGRLRLHLKKNYQHNLRGTKYSLPKPGSGDRFQGDLLLSEDQMMMGAWNQKVKVRTGGKARTSAESMFGHGIASDVGCNTRALDVDDIRPGFGRRNPNSAKGRERRGKKKKTSNKACGLRRY